MYKQAGWEFFLGIILGVILLGVVALSILIFIGKLLLEFYAFISILLM
jgi:hypothetical protein